MTTGPGGAAADGAARVAVLLAAAGASWEPEALDRLSRSGPAVVVTRRCVDLTDLLATAGTGAASVAVVSPALPGLDADSVASLRRSRVAVVVVAAPEELLDGDTERIRRIGVEHLLVGSELGALADSVRRAAVDASGGVAGDGAGARGRLPDGLHAGEATGPGPGAVAGTGRVVAVWGPAGAPGRTTVAVAVAGEAAAAGTEVLLVDADAYGGAVAQHLGVLEEVSGLLVAARAANAGRLDAATLAGAAREVAPGLRVLTGLPRPDRWQEVRPAAFEALLDRAAELVPLVVLDLGFSLEGEPLDPFGGAGPRRNLMTLSSLERADEVVVVGAADPVGLARLAHGLVELHEVVPGLRPRVVVNRTRPSLGWSDREVRGMVEGFVRPLDVHFLPEDRAAADRALMAGRSLGETGDSRLHAAVRALAAAVLGTASPRARARRRGIRRRRAATAR